MEVSGTEDSVDLTPKDTLDLVKHIGPGRPKRGQDRHAETYRRAIDRLHELVDPAITSLERLLEGVWREQVDRDGNVIRIYQTLPNVDAIKVVLEKVLGKNPLQVNVDAKVSHSSTLDLSSLSQEDLFRTIDLLKEVLAQESITVIDGEAIVIESE